MFCVIKLHWDYDNRTVDIIIPEYVEKFLQKYQQPTPCKPEHQPHQDNPTHYRQRVQFYDPEYNTPTLKKSELKQLMEVIGSLLFLGRSVDNTLLTVLSYLASDQAKEKKATKAAARKLLEYCATHPNSKIRFQGRQMDLKVHSDASYLSAIRERSHVGGT